MVSSGSTSETFRLDDPALRTRVRRPPFVGRTRAPPMVSGATSRNALPWYPPPVRSCAVDACCRCGRVPVEVPTDGYRREETGEANWKLRRELMSEERPLRE